MTSLQIIEQYYTYFNQKNWQGMLSLLDSNIRHEPNQGEPRIGLEKYAAFLKEMDEAYEENLSDMIFMVNETGDRIAAEFTVKGTYKRAQAGLPPAHGQAYTLPAGAFLEVRNDKITRVTTYYNLPLWIKLVS